MRARHTLVIWISQLLLLLAWNLFAVVSSNNEKTRHDVHSYTEVELGNDTVEALFIFRYSQMYTQIQCAAHTFTLAHIYAHTEQLNTLYIIRTVALFWYTHSLSLSILWQSAQLTCLLRILSLTDCLRIVFFQCMFTHLGNVGFERLFYIFNCFKLNKKFRFK